MTEAALHAHPEFINWIIFHGLRSYQFMSLAGRVLQPEDFMEEERPYRLAWAIARDWFNNHKQTVPRSAFELEVGARLNEDSDYLDDTEFGVLEGLMELGYATPESDLFPERMCTELEQFLANRRVKKTVMEFRDDMSMTEIDGLLTTVRQAQQSSKITTSGRVAGFLPGEACITALPRHRCGFAPVDELLGGTRPEVCGFLGPSGGGKTLTAVQWTWENVRTLQHSAYLAYENKFDPEYNVRFYGFMGNIPMERIIGRSFDQLEQRDQIKINTELERFGRYFHPQNMLDEASQGVGFGGVEEVRTFVDTLAQKGEKPEMIVIDQFWHLVQRYMAAKNISDERTRTVMAKSVDQFVQLSTEYQVFILLLHQLNPTVANKPPHVRPKWGDAAECKSFAFWLQNCLALGTMDDKHRAWLVASKVRNGAKSEIIVEVDGGNFKLDYQPGKLIEEHKRFVSVTEEQDRSVPLTRTPAPSRARVESTEDAGIYGTR